MIDSKQELEQVENNLKSSVYPREYTKRMRLTNGRSVVLRSIKPEDESLEAEMFQNLSDQTEHARLFYITRNITHEFLKRFTQIDYSKEVAIIAEIMEKGKIKMAGVVRLIADSVNEKAELAVVIADPWQEQGIGRILIDYMLEIAKRRGIKTIFAHVLSDNVKMLKMLSRRGFNLVRKDDVYYANLNV